MYVAFALMLMMMFATLNLYLGFATAIYMHREGAAANLHEYLWFLAHGKVLTWDVFMPTGKPETPSSSNTASAIAAAMASAPGPAVEEAEDDKAAEPPQDELAAMLVAPRVEDTSIGRPKGEPAVVVYESARNELRGFASELCKLDQHLREVVGTPAGETLQACGVSLNETVERRLRGLAEVLAPLTDGTLPAVAESPVRGTFAPAVSTAGNTLNEVLSALVGLPFDRDDRTAVTEPLLAAHTQTLQLVHSLRDELTAKLVKLVADEAGLSKLAPYLRSDQQTGLACRAGFDIGVLEQQSDAADAASMILLDIDGLGEINQQYGAMAGDGLVSVVAQFLATARLSDQLAARTRGQQFALLCNAVAARDAAETAERLRQSIEKTTFLYRGQSIHITVSAGVVAVRDDDVADTAMDRAVATVREAKSYGRNRTFLWEDECPTPVVPMDLIIEVQEVSL